MRESESESHKARTHSQMEEETRTEQSDGLTGSKEVGREGKLHTK